MFFLSAWALYLYGGNSMQGLALTHMIGAVVVVVSSIVVAVPMLSVRPFAVTKQDLMPKAKDEAALARRP
jgi:preprotein translocase subunit SecF